MKKTQTPIQMPKPSHYVVVIVKNADGTQSGQSKLAVRRAEDIEAVKKSCLSFLRVPAGGTYSIEVVEA